MSGTSGRGSRKLSAFFDQDTSTWRTWRDTLDEGSTSSSVILTDSGMWAHGRLSGPLMWERRISASVSSSTPAMLPTPAVNDMGAGKTVEQWDEWTAAMRAKHGNGNGHGKSLSIEAQRLLPTPDASAHKYRLGGGSQQSRSLEARARRGELATYPDSTGPQGRTDSQACGHGESGPAAESDREDDQ